MLARFIAVSFPNVFVKDDKFLDYMGDRIPRELLPRDPNDNRFTRSRDDGGGRDRGGFRGGRGGGFRSRNNDRGGYRADRSSSDRPASSDRPRFASNDGDSRTDREQRGSFNEGAAPRGFRRRDSGNTGGGYSPERSSSEGRSERKDRGGDHPGIKRSRSGGGSSERTSARRFRD